MPSSAASSGAGRSFGTRLLAGAAIVVMTALTSGHGCSDEDSSKSVGSPCTRTSECQEGLICSGGVCADPVADSGTDADS